MKIRLSQYRDGVFVQRTVQLVRIHVEYQNAVAELLPDEQPVIRSIHGHHAGSVFPEVSVRFPGVVIVLPDHRHGLDAGAEIRVADIEYQDAPVAVVGDVQMLEPIVVGEPARAGEAVAAQTALPGRQVRLTDDESRFHAILEPVRMDVPYQDPVVAAVRKEIQLPFGIDYA